MFYYTFISVLDEATSQVSLDMERILYEQCHKLGITLCSVGHRDSLRAFHQCELHLDGCGGWCITDLRTEEGSGENCHLK